jgi:hypothetical protein
MDLEIDPVEAGLVASIARPGGNIGGLFLDLSELSGKHLQILKEIIPGTSRVALLGRPDINATQIRELERVARSLAVQIRGNTNTSPANGSRPRSSCTSNAKSCMPFLISVWPVAIQIRTPVGTAIIGAPEPQAHAPTPSHRPPASTIHPAVPHDDYHLSGRGRGRHRRRCLHNNHRGHEPSLFRLRAGWLRAKQAPPGHQQGARYAMASRFWRYRPRRLQALKDNPELPVIRPSPPSAGLNDLIWTRWSTWAYLISATTFPGSPTMVNGR